MMRTITGGKPPIFNDDGEGNLENGGYYSQRPTPIFAPPTPKTAGDIAHIATTNIATNAVAEPIVVAIQRNTLMVAINNTALYRREMRGVLLGKIVDIKKGETRLMTKTREAINTVGLRASDMAGQPPFVQPIGYVYMKDWAVNPEQIIDKPLHTPLPLVLSDGTIFTPKPQDTPPKTIGEITHTATTNVATDTPVIIVDKPKENDLLQRAKNTSPLTKLLAVVIVVIVLIRVFK